MFLRVAAWHLLAAVLFVGQIVVSTPEPKFVSSDEASQHLIKRTTLAYPEVAEMAHIQGHVVLMAVIDQNGKVSDLRSLMGHPMLVASALDAVKEWKFEPFKEDDKPVSVRTQIQLDFLQGVDNYEKYLQQEVNCSQQIAHQSPKAEESCKSALDVAMKLPKNSLKANFVQEKMRAYRNAGFAAKLAQKNDEATADFKQQLLLARQALEESPNAPQAPFHLQLAHAYKNLDDLHQADSEYTEAERARELTLHGSRTVPYDLQVIVREHAALLRQMDRNADAETLEKKWSPANQ